MLLQVPKVLDADQVGGGHYMPGADRTFMLSADFSF